MDKKTYPQNIIFFDGVCSLCNHSVDFIIRRDKKNLFLFSSLQSSKAQEILKGHHYPLDKVKNLSNIVYLRKGKIKIKSKAALLICWDIGGILRLGTLLLIIPSFILDFFYDIIAKYRYQWFGKKESCRIPTQEEQGKFLKDS